MIRVSKASAGRCGGCRRCCEELELFGLAPPLRWMRADRRRTVNDHGLNLQDQHALLIPWAGQSPHAALHRLRS